MMLRRHFLVPTVCLAMLMCACAPEAVVTPAAPEKGPEQIALEAGISPVPLVTGETPKAVLLAERMAALGVPGVSIAVYRDGAPDWAAGYGEGVDAGTLFQAASLSKMVASVGIVALAQEKGVDLDTDISGALAGVDLAALNPEGLPITLRALLSHTNGANVSGFPGYAAGAPVPSTLEVITGSARTNTPAVVIRRPDAANPYSYSGGGYTVAQYWAEQVSGEDFAALMQRLVLDPVGMEASIFVQPLPEALAGGNVAAAHDSQGAEIPGRWHTYPELAAAGLWTTSSDFGRFLMALTGRAEGIDPAVAAEVTRPVVSDYGLGIGIVSNDGEVSLRHSGGNAGYTCYALVWPARGDAIVVMTNADNGFRLYRDIVETAGALYGWPPGGPAPRQREELSAEVLAMLAGQYVVEGTPNMILEFSAGEGELLGASPIAGNFRAVPVEGGALVSPEDGFEIRYEISGSDVRLSVMGMTLVKAPQE
jgi:CubicO group peptidase (beta-lactamase class C family)